MTPSPGPSLEEEAYFGRVILNNGNPDDGQIPMDDSEDDGNPQNDDEDEDQGPKQGFKNSIVATMESTQIPTDIKPRLIAILEAHRGACMTKLRRDPIRTSAVIRQIWNVTSPNPISKQYPVFGEKREHMVEEGKMMIRMGLAQQKFGVWSNPCSVVEKRTDGKKRGLRTVCDLRWLNSQTAMPQVNALNHLELANMFAGAKVFCSADMFRAFKQVALAPEDRQYFGASYPELGRLEPYRLAEGWSASPMALQMVLDDVFFHGPKQLAKWVDDLALGREDWENLLIDLQVLLETCVKHNVGLKDTLFFGTKLKFAGCIFEDGKMTRAPQTLGTLKTMPLETAAGLTTLVGMFNFFISCVFGLDIDLIPLRRVLLTAARKVDSSKSSKLRHVKLADCGFDTTHKALIERIFKEIEDRLMLQIPVPDQDTNIITDASDFYGAGIITQSDPSQRKLPVFERNHKIVLFFTCAFTQTERNYTIAEREFLVLVKVMERAEPLLRPLPMIYCYLDNLNCVHAMKDMTKSRVTLGRMLRQEAKVRSYPCQLIHLPGNRNWCDQFSRPLEPPTPQLENVELEVTADTIQQIDGHVTRSKSNRYGVRSAIPPTLEDFAHRETSDFAQECMDEGAVINDKGVLTLPDGRIVLPQDMVEPLVWLAHQQVGHRGQATTYKMLEQHFYTKNLKEEVAQIVKRCYFCAANHRKHLEPRPLGDPPIGAGVGHTFLVDVFHMPIAADKSQYFILYVDEVSKFGVACTMIDRSVESTRKTLDILVSIVGFCPQVFHRDGGSEFQAAYDEWIKLSGAETHIHTPHWQASHGSVERLGQEVRRLLRIQCAMYGMDETNWHKMLTPVMWIYNNAPHTALRDRCPSEFMPLRKVHKPGLEQVKSLLSTMIPPTHIIPSDKTDQALEEHKEAFHDLERDVMELQGELRTVRRSLWNKKHRIHDTSELVEGAFVMLAKAHAGPYPSTKMSTPWYGPHKIIQVLHPNKIQVQLLGSDLLEEAVVDRVRFFDGPDVDQLLQHELLRLADTNRPGASVIKEIIGYKRRGKTSWSIQVKWTDDSVTWEPVTKLYYQVSELIERFWDSISNTHKADVKDMKRICKTSTDRRKR